MAETAKREIQRDENGKFSKVNVVNLRFGRLIALNPIKRERQRALYWECKCDCGNTVIVRGDSLRRSETLSCGCYQKEIAKITGAKTICHGMHGTRVFLCWGNMIQRCENKNHNSYSKYGGRGIKVCHAWHDASIFIKWALANGYKNNLTIDRIDPDGNYEPSNCRWITREENSARARKKGFRNAKH